MVAGMVTVVINKDLRERATSIVKPGHYTNIERIQLWQLAWEGIRQHPLFGLGPGHFDVFVENTYGMQVHFGDPHNLYLRFWVERGLFGLAGLLWLFAVFSIKFYKSAPPWRVGMTAAFLGLLVAGITESWYTDSEIAMSLFFMVGVACQLTERKIMLNTE
jgi:O-antigen ligase